MDADAFQGLDGGTVLTDNEAVATVEPLLCRYVFVVDHLEWYFFGHKSKQAHNGT